MSLFPILQLCLITVFAVLFFGVWLRGLWFILAVYDVSPPPVSAYSAKGLTQLNDTHKAMREMENVPIGQKLDWWLKRLTLCGCLIAVSFGAEWLLAAVFDLEKSGGLR